MAIEKITNKDIVTLEIPTGVLRVYDFDETLTLLKKRLLKK